MRQPATILVVDDERAVRMMLEAALRAQGYRVQSAATGTAAYEMLAEEEFDLVLLDLQLGDTDGIEILREIAPSVTRFGIMYNPRTAPGGGAYYMDLIKRAADTLRVRTIPTAPR